jgi:hypothetical protein
MLRNYSCPMSYRWLANLRGLICLKSAEPFYRLISEQRILKSELERTRAEGCASVKRICALALSQML